MRFTSMIAAIAVAIGLVTGCGSDGDSVATGALASAEGVVSTLFEGTLELEIQGAVEGSWSGSTPIRVVTVVGAGAPENNWFLSVGLEQPVDAAEWKLRPAFDLVPYSGNGTYDVTPDGKAIHRDPDKDVTNGGELAAPLKGGAFVVAGRGEAPPINFNEVLQPCVFDIGERGLTGSVDCPEVGGGGAGSVAFRWSWDADESSVLESETDEEAVPGSSGDGAVTGPTVEPGASEEVPGTGGGSGEDAAQPLLLEVSVTPCVERGEVVRVTVATEPAASVALALAYSDSQPHGGTSIGTSDDKGSYSAAFSVPAIAPLGEASALVSAASADGKRSNSATKKFRVEESC